MTDTTPSPLGNVIAIDDERIKSHLDVRNVITPQGGGSVTDLATHGGLVRTLRSCRNGDQV